MEAAITSMMLQWGAASLARPGESESGDRYVVETFDGGALVAVIDALGHGHDAAYAANIAADTLREYAYETPTMLIERCHARMRNSRGATISVASFDWRKQIMVWLGIGNVSGLLTGVDNRVRMRSKSLLVRSGVVGDHIPDLGNSTIGIGPDDQLILTSDGVRSQFVEMLPSSLGPQPLAEQILERYATGGDDATVVVFRCATG